MPPGLWRSRACPPPPPPPRWLGGRRPRRRLLLPPPPEGCPGPAFIGFLLLRFSALSMKGCRFRLPCSALGEAPHSRADFSMRGNPDAIGKILNDLFRLKRAWSQWARRASTGSVAAGNTFMLPALRNECKCKVHTVLHRGVDRDPSPSRRTLRQGFRSRGSPAAPRSALGLSFRR
jgi:hypothetical protein